MRFAIPIVVLVLVAAGTVAATSPKPLVHVEGSTAPTHRILNGAGTAQLLLNPSTGATEAALTLLTLEPGAQVPEHTHDASTELLYVEAGELELVVAGRTVHAKPGDAIRIPTGVKHSARVVGTVAARAVQVYVGPGPEQRFTAGPRVTK